MSALTVPSTGLVERDRAKIKEFLTARGILFEKWQLQDLGESPSPEDILAAYAEPIEAIKKEKHFQFVDTSTIEAPAFVNVYEKFVREHTHSEDEYDSHGSVNVLTAVGFASGQKDAEFSGFT
jgi:cupin superfamily acireductone dioxygenase involved in methionine salvage